MEMISVQTYTPQALTPFIKSFWYLKVSSDLKQPYLEEILPDGHHEIIFHVRAAPIRKKAGSNEWHRDPQFFFTGQNRKSYLHQFDPGSEIYAIRFHPHTQALFFDFPAAMATDTLIPFIDMYAHDRLAACIDESPAKTFANLEKEFLRRVSQLQNHDNAFLYTDAAVTRIVKEKGNVKMDVLEKITGVSGRHLEKSFQKFVGLSPKQFCNIVRYNHFVTYRKNNPDKTLTECAHETDFHDQSHLIYLSRLITGQSPKAYFQKQNIINDIFLPG